MPEPPSPAPRRLLTGRRFALVAAVVLLVQWEVAHVAAALVSAASRVPTLGDGPYQLFNPLRRIAAGQRGGVDFQFFHGLGVPYLHYPLFALNGGDYRASEFARHTVTNVLYLAGYLAVFAAATRRFAPTVWLTAGALLLTEPLGLVWLSQPGNSLMGVRGAAPFFLFALLLAGVRPRREAVAAGALVGAAVVAGTEHGVAAAAVLAVVWVGRAVAGLPGGRLWWPALAGVVAVAVAGGFLLAVGGPGGTAAALRFAFVEVPNDQFWYFGGTAPNTLTRSVRAVLSDQALMAHVVAVLALGALVVGRARRSADAKAQAPVFLGALAYGSLATIGYFAMPQTPYLAALVRVELVIVLALGWRAVVVAAAHPGIGPAVARNGAIVAAGVLAVGIVAGPTRVRPSSLFVLDRDIRAIATAWAGVPVLATETLRTDAHIGAMVRAIDEDRAAAGGARPPVIWSTYAGLLEAHYGVFHPDADYIIHALGPARREKYLAAFRAAKPDYVCTLRRAYHMPHEEWLQQTAWPFYEELARNYEVRGRTWAGVLWRRRAGPWRDTETAAETAYAPPHPDGFPIQRPAGAGETDPLVVELDYETQAPLASVPVLGKLPRYFLVFVDADAATSLATLPPAALSGGKVSVVVRPVPGKVPWGWVVTESLLGARVRIRNVRVRALPPDVAAVVTDGFFGP